MECGTTIEKPNDVKSGDVIGAYVLTRLRQNWKRPVAGLRHKANGHDGSCLHD